MVAVLEMSVLEIMCDPISPSGRNIAEHCRVRPNSASLRLVASAFPGNRGCARFEQGGEAREAVQDFDQSLELEPAQPLAFLQKGQALLEMQVGKTH